MLLTKKILRVLIAKKQVARFKTIKSITSKGLYIHREIGPVLAKTTLQIIDVTKVTGEC